MQGFLFTWMKFGAIVQNSFTLAKIVGIIAGAFLPGGHTAQMCCPQLARTMSTEIHSGVSE